MPRVPQTNSGSHSSQEKLLISTQSLQLTTPPRLMKSKLTKYLKGLLYDSPKTCPTLQSQNGSSAMQMNGLQLGTRTPRQSSLRSCIGPESSPSTSSTCHPFSEPQLSLSTATCSSLTGAIHNRVGRCRNILLSDTDKFRDLECSHISPAGMAYQEFEERRAVPKSQEREWRPREES